MNNILVRKPMRESRTRFGTGTTISNLVSISCHSLGNATLDIDYDVMKAHSKWYAVCSSSDSQAVVTLIYRRILGYMVGRDRMAEPF